MEHQTGAVEKGDRFIFEGALVLAPKELREEITKELKDSLKNYKGKTPVTL